MIVLIGIALVAGFVTAISPCVLPVLPVLLAGGATGRKPLRIIAGLVASFVVFTLFASWILGKLGLPQDLLRNLAIALLFVVAATLLVPQLARLVERPFARLTRYRAGGGGFLLGASLGLVFTPCAGPVLGAISTQAAQERFGWRAILLTVAYAVGAGVPMLLIAYGGQGRVDPPARSRCGASARLRRSHRPRRARPLVQPRHAARDTRPGLRDVDPELDRRQQVGASKQLAKITGTKKALVAKSKPGNSGRREPPASELRARPRDHTPGGDWFNSKPLKLSQLRGKVVLIDFWTYSCINCLRTLPHLEAWDAAYRSKGLVIIGVHTPEFAFEHVASNVQAAVKRLGIHYPVVQDNNYGTWNAYSNQYWPAEYLIDRTGHVRHYHFGESSYGETENLIRQLLGVQGPKARALPDLTPTEASSPESYLGFRAPRRATPGRRCITTCSVAYVFPKTLGTGRSRLLRAVAGGVAAHHRGDGRTASLPLPRRARLPRSRRKRQGRGLRQRAAHEDGGRQLVPPLHAPKRLAG